MLAWSRLARIIRTGSVMGTIFQQRSLSSTSLEDFCNIITETSQGCTQCAPPGFKGQVEFDQISFPLPTDGSEVLRGVQPDNSDAGEVIGVVRTLRNLGRAPLTRLLQRLLHAREGKSPLLMGMDLALADVSSLRRPELA